MPHPARIAPGVPPCFQRWHPPGGIIHGLRQSGDFLTPYPLGFLCCGSDVTRDTGVTRRRLTRLLGNLTGGVEIRLMPLLMEAICLYWPVRAFCNTPVRQPSPLP